MDDGKIAVLMMLQSFRTPITEKVKALLAQAHAKPGCKKQEVMDLNVALCDKIGLL